MEWSTAAGIGGLAVTAITVITGFLWLVRRCLTLGDEANASHLAQLDAEHFKREAEDQRDKAIARATQLDKEREAALEALKKARDHAAEINALRLREIEEDIVDASGDDLIALSHRIMGLLPEVPQASPATPTTPGSGDDSPDALLNPFPAKEGRSDKPEG